tara:strand:- start:29 stop:421 length:393 start_codon:yes stop_codon:yes gene_type:complete
MIGFSALMLGSNAFASASGHDHGDHDHGKKSGPIHVTGEVVDLMCYVDHDGKGEKHKKCAEKCIKGGGPVGILTSKGELYLVIGNHKPANDKLAKFAAQTITLEGKASERNGMKMLSNAQVVDKDHKHEH